MEKYIAISGLVGVVLIWVVSLIIIGLKNFFTTKIRKIMNFLKEIKKLFNREGGQIPTPE